MDRVNLDETRETLAEIVARVESGETVVITRGGQPVAKVEPVERTKKKLKPINIERLRKLTEKMTFQKESAGDFMRRLRDEDRY